MQYEAIIHSLSQRTSPPPLYPREPWQPELTTQIGACATSDVCRCGLLVWNDDIDAAHTITQGIETPTGSFWHAIIHRREGDAGNSRYWWAQTGDHPAFAAIYDAALEQLGRETERSALAFRGKLQTACTWLPVEFVARCEQAKGGPDSGWLERLQLVEIRTLLDWCRKQGAS